MIARESGLLLEYKEQLNPTFGLKGLSRLDKAVLAKNRADVSRALAELEDFSTYVATASDDQLFNETIKLGGYVFRKCIAARTALLRHTPTLRGRPLALAPSQNHLMMAKPQTVDYGRGGYVLFQQPDKRPQTLFKDHPDLETIASRMKDKLYGGSGLKDVRAIIFTSGLGAVNTFNDYMKSLSQDSARRNYIGENCWIELKKQVSESNDGSFVFFDETDKKRIRRLLKDDNVQSISLEGIQNYATLRASDLEEIAAIAAKTNFRKPKFLVIDHVQTFDTDLFSKFFSADMPKNFCLAVFTSGVKFIQGGWDIGKSGFLFMKYNLKDFAAADPYQRVLEMRSVSGRVPSLEEAYLSDIDTKDALRSRLRRYDRNMEILATQLDRDFSASRLGQVYSAWLPGHPDHEIARRCYATGGRILYVKLAPEKFSETDVLELYRFMADRAFEEKTPLMAASNFGFATPHIHVLRQNKVGLVIRIGSGSSDIGTTEEVGRFITRQVKEFAWPKNKT